MIFFIISCGTTDPMLYSELVGSWDCMLKGYACSQLLSEECEETIGCEWIQQLYPVSDWTCSASNGGGMLDCSGTIMEIKTEHTFLISTSDTNSLPNFAGSWERNPYDNKVTFTYHETNETITFEYTVGDTLVLNQTNPANPGYREVWSRR